MQEPGKPPRSLKAAVGVTIGRGASNSVPLEDDAASVRHAEVVLEGETLCVRDLGSSNGTRVVGGVKLTRGASQPLRVGLELQIGRTVVRVLDETGSDLTLRPQAAAADATLRPSPAPYEAATMSPAPKPAAIDAMTLRPAPAPAPAPA
ncbi:MAG: FHA domain-containing protein, partial [Planctomycetota bacterium]